MVGQYIYDAWGNHTIVTDIDGIATLNPIRYRGYYYDQETGLYYVKSRYYDPTIGRWISPDNAIAGIGGDVKGYNLYSYCMNNPVALYDPTGEWPSWGQIFKVAAAVVTIAVAAVAIAVAAPVLTTALAIGYTSAAIVAGATVACATVSMYCGACEVVETVAGVNPLKEGIGEEAYEAVYTTSTYLMTAGTSALAPLVPQNTPSQQQDSFLPDDYYSNKKAPTQSVPNSSYVNYKYNDYTEVYEKSTSFYDFAGRYSIRVDWTNHGYSNHGNPHVHYKTYNAQYPYGKEIRLD